MDEDSCVLGVDVGGTFTDVVAWDGDALSIGKVLSTPEDQSIGVVAGARAVDVAAGRLIHGTTVATNALLERKGAVTALITTEGFEDVVEIGRQDRTSLYDTFAGRPEPLVARERRIGAAMDGTGVPGLAEHLAGAEVVAIALLDSYRDAMEEDALAAAVEAVRPDLAVSLSSRVAPEFREFERTSTTILNAYLTPVTARYLQALVERAAGSQLPADISVMRSSGGLMPVGDAAELAAAMLLSGPAGGVVAAAAIGADLGWDRVISLDMGGTSTDVCRIEGGRPEVAYERPIDGYPCRLPSVGVHTVGAGGGSIAWVDRGKALRVGPQSSGAVPGPACYDTGGTDPTVTDANVALGRIGSGTRLAGSMPIQAELALQALHGVGDQIALAGEATALGIVTVVEEVMAGAIRRVSIEQGADPREAILVGFGGAGGLHTTALARRLEMAGAVIPAHAGVFSALGLLLSPPRVDAGRSVLLSAAERDRLPGELTAIGVLGSERLAAAGWPARRLETFADVRYLGQSHELSIPAPADITWDELAERFHQAHQRRNGFARPGDPIEVVTVRAEAEADPTMRWADIPPLRPVGPDRVGSREVLTAEGAVSATVWRWGGLEPGRELVGPAIVEADESTTYLAPAERAVVHQSGALEVSW